MRNSDYSPSRISCQHDAANLIASQKTQSNPESTVGVLKSSDASSKPTLLVSPTDDVGKILQALHGLSPVGESNVASSVQIAQLALKHRRNKNGGQRVVIFVGSPVPSEQHKSLVKAGKMLKKNNVAVDVVCMGEVDENEKVLSDMVQAADSNGNSHLVTVPPGVNPSDVLLSSPIMNGGDGGGGGMGGGSSGENPTGAAEGGNPFAEYGGIDPSMDPELAMALRVSMEEERARLAAQQEQQEGEQQGGQQDGQGSQQADASESKESGGMDVDMDSASAVENAAFGGGLGGADYLQGMGTDDDEAMQLALAMSMAAEEESSNNNNNNDNNNNNNNTDDDNTTTGNAEFVSTLIGSLEGVDPNDPAIQQALRDAGVGNDDDGKNDASGDKEKKDE